MEEPASPDFLQIRPARPPAGLDKAWPGQAKGVLARPGTPRVPKNHLLATKWVAIKDLEASPTANLTRIPLRIFLEGSRGSYLDFFLTICWTQNPGKVKNLKKKKGFRLQDNQQNLEKVQNLTLSDWKASKSDIF